MSKCRECEREIEAGNVLCPWCASGDAPPREDAAADAAVPSSAVETLRNRRALAGAIDYAIVWAVSYAVTFFVAPQLYSGLDAAYQNGGDASVDTLTAQMGMGGFVLSFLIALTYFAGMQTWRGKTLGMGLAGLSVEGADGARPAVEQSIKRSAFLSLLLPFTGVIELIVLASSGSTLGDKLSGTTVVLSDSPADEPGTVSAHNKSLAPELDVADCPFCAEPIKRAALKCKHCGSDLKQGWASHRD